jgi:GR25 family glycosyltransferase involved in LPS biosynthesis
MAKALPFDRVLYINLEERKDRNNAILKELDRLDIPKDRIVRIEAIKDPLNPSKGCTLSHIKALDYALQNRLNRVWILEDDAIFISNKKALQKAFKTIAQNDEWDVFLLGGNLRKFSPISSTTFLRAYFCVLAHSYIVDQKFLAILRCFLQSVVNTSPQIDDPKARATFSFDFLWLLLMQDYKFYFLQHFFVQNCNPSDIDKKTKWSRQNLFFPKKEVDLDHSAESFIMKTIGHHPLQLRVEKLDTFLNPLYRVYLETNQLIHHQFFVKKDSLMERLSLFATCKVEFICFDIDEEDLILDIVRLFRKAPFIHFYKVFKITKMLKSKPINYLTKKLKRLNYILINSGFIKLDDELHIGNSIYSKKSIMYPKKIGKMLNM